MATDPKQPKLRKNGQPDGRGHGSGSSVTRFQAGDGRPRPGRTKGSRDERTEVEEVLAMTVEVTQDGRRRRANTRQAILLRQRQKALAGDHRAAAYLNAKFTQYAPPAIDPNLTRPLLDEDAAILALAYARGVLPGPAEPALPTDDGATPPDGNPLPPEHDAAR